MITAREIDAATSKARASKQPLPVKDLRQIGLIHPVVAVKIARQRLVRTARGKLRPDFGWVEHDVP